MTSALKGKLQGVYVSSSLARRVRCRRGAVHHITNGYRAMWAAKAEADVRTTVDTAHLNGANPFDVVLAALA